jgi:hypothetical protein
MASQIKNFLNRHPQEDKENSGHENFDNAKVAASPPMLFDYSGKESRLQEPYGFPESANILSTYKLGTYYNNLVSFGYIYLPF